MATGPAWKVACASGRGVRILHLPPLGCSITVVQQTLNLYSVSSTLITPAI